MSAVEDHNNGECGRWCPVCFALDDQDAQDAAEETA